MTASPEPYPDIELGRIRSRFSPDILALLFEADAETHDSVWASIQPDEAAFVRRGVLHAQQLREQAVDPGDAYLQGMAVTLAAQRLQRDIDESLRARTALYMQTGAAFLRLVTGETDDDVSGSSPAA